MPIPETVSKCQNRALV